MRSWFLGNDLSEGLWPARVPRRARFSYQQDRQSVKNERRATWRRYMSAAQALWYICQVAWSNGTTRGIVPRTTNERRKEGRKDNEGVDPAPRNHTPRRESWRRDSFLVTLRCLTGPMTSGGRAMMEEPINGTRVDPIDVWSFIYRRGDWRKKEKGKRRGWKSFDNCSLKLESEVWWKNWKMLMLRNDRIGNNLEEYY